MRAPAFPSVARAVARSVARRRNVQAAYIFGSTATGRSRPDSDVDVAVLLAQRRGRDRTLTDRLKLIADLQSARETQSPARPAREEADRDGRVRNILVHEYLEIDRHRVHRALKDQVGDFEKFIKAVSKF